MAKYKIAWLPGDGVGNDVMEAAKLVLDATSFDAEYVPGEVGWECWESYGDPLPPATVEILKATDCCLFGAITSKPGVKGYKSLIVRARQLFQLYANVRPCKAYPGNPLNYRDTIDMVVFRENTEGLYSGLDFHPPLIPEVLAIPGLENADPDNSAISIRHFTRKGCQRIVRAAFEYAVKHNRKKVTSIAKANVIRATCGMFLEEAEKIAKEYPNIEYWNANRSSTCVCWAKAERSEIFGTQAVFTTASRYPDSSFSRSWMLPQTSTKFIRLKPTPPYHPCLLSAKRGSSSISSLVL